MVRLEELYKKEIIPQLKTELGLTNPMQVPKVQKIVINMGMGKAVQNPKIIDSAVDDLRKITGQQPIIRKAKKAIANFKLREGLPIGVTVTLRKERMYDFIDRLVHVALPRVRDFRGVSRTAFDGRGNYTLGISEQIIFPEIDMDKTEIKGLAITFVTTATTNEACESLLEKMGMPFRKQQKRKGEVVTSEEQQAEQV
jgi:large subunit ribosomal protein L5